MWCHKLNKTKAYELADAVMVTRRTYTRKFHKTAGMAFGEWLASERLNLARDLLESTDLSIDQIVAKTGFSFVLIFRDKFKERYDVTPNRWRKTFHQKLEISFLSNDRFSLKD